MWKSGFPSAFNKHINSFTVNHYLDICAACAASQESYRLIRNSTGKSICNEWQMPSLTADPTVKDIGAILPIPVYWGIAGSPSSTYQRKVSNPCITWTILFVRGCFWVLYNYRFPNRHRSDYCSLGSLERGLSALFWWHVRLRHLGWR